VSVVLAVGCAQAQQETQQAPPSTQQPAAPPSDTQQTQPPASTAGSSSSSSSSAPAAPSERRFSGGAILSYVGLSLISGGTSTVNNTTEISTQYQSSSASEHIGYGLTLQSRITNHFYLNLSGLLRRMGYQETTTVSTTVTAVLNGSTYPSTTTTSTHEDTRSRLIDIPVLVRYYGTPKRPRSPRWFVEGGGTWRLANDIRTSIDSTDANGDVTCCTTTPAVPKDRHAVGATVGAGIQFTDEFGIKVVPEFRYTRWFEPIFENLTTRTQVNQIEAGFSLTF
jgi:opacity protein-like surface antigen